MTRSGKLILSAVLAVAAGLLATSLIDRGAQKAEHRSRAVDAGEASGTVLNAEPGRIVWASWHDREDSAPATAKQESWAMRDPLKTREIPEKVRKELENRFRGTTVSLPGVVR